MENNFYAPDFKRAYDDFKNGFVTAHTFIEVWQANLNLVGFELDESLREKFETARREFEEKIFPIAETICELQGWLANQKFEVNDNGCVQSSQEL